MALDYRHAPTNERDLRFFFRLRDGGKRDYQRSKVYEWDYAVRQTLLADIDDLTQDECEELTKEVWDVLGLMDVAPPPSVEITKQKKSYSTYYCDHGRKTIPEHHIRLAERWGGKMETVLHEIAHAVLAVVDTVPYRNHGPAFVSVLRDLYRLWHPYKENWADGGVFRIQRHWTKGEELFIQRPADYHPEADVDFIHHVADVVGVDYSGHSAFSLVANNAVTYQEFTRS